MTPKRLWMVTILASACMAGMAHGRDTVSPKHSQVKRPQSFTFHRYGVGLSSTYGTPPEGWADSDEKRLGLGLVMDRYALQQIQNWPLILEEKTKAVVSLGQLLDSEKQFRKHGFDLRVDGRVGAFLETHPHSLCSLVVGPQFQMEGNTLSQSQQHQGVLMVGALAGGFICRDKERTASMGIKVTGSLDMGRFVSYVDHRSEGQPGRLKESHGEGPFSGGGVQIQYVGLDSPETRSTATGVEVGMGRNGLITDRYLKVHFAGHFGGKKKSGPGVGVNIGLHQMDSDGDSQSPVHRDLVDMSTEVYVGGAFH